MLNQLFVDQMREFTMNQTQMLESRQAPKGAKAPGGARSGGSSGAGTCGDDERGHQIASGGTGMAAHMAYNRDGYYVEAASCYITKKFKAASGAA
jgi:hypothetical protein